ncbi:hypothetical protein [Nonomuraea rubra]|uniref:Putative metalloprotease n=1 Tax=Nonomuraea rubra TaxID=46180 RepID=A0A7X0TW92_9ACTN|nr:hypothetical protein [Nonomuraea rubra]MBB6545939.1 putative metalloprotease [Nonomuraea rubra]
MKSLRTAVLACALPTTTCAERKAGNGNVKQASTYFDAVVTCLETTWENHFTDAGLTYGKVNVKHVTKFPKKWCGMETDKDDSQALYCAKNRTLRRVWASPSSRASGR